MACLKQPRRSPRRMTQDKMSRVVIKICGLTRTRDIDAAIAAGADALGFVFAASARRLTAGQAEPLLERVPAGVLRVGLFLDQERAEVDAVLERLTLDLLQFHGQEDSEFCGSFGLPYLKAVGMRHNPSLHQVEREYASAAGLLLDSHGSGERGGTGETFDWRRIPPLSKPVWLAGGLHAGNVGAAVAAARPYAVDVSSGVESRPGVKDAASMQAFVEAVREAGEQTGEVRNP